MFLRVRLHIIEKQQINTRWTRLFMNRLSVISSLLFSFLPIIMFRAILTFFFFQKTNSSFNLSENDSFAWNNVAFFLSRFIFYLSCHSFKKMNMKNMYNAQFLFKYFNNDKILLLMKFSTRKRENAYCFHGLRWMNRLMTHQLNRRSHWSRNKGVFL